MKRSAPSRTRIKSDSGDLRTHRAEISLREGAASEIGARSTSLLLLVHCVTARRTPGVRGTHSLIHVSALVLSMFMSGALDVTPTPPP